MSSVTLEEAAGLPRVVCSCGGTPEYGYVQRYTMMRHSLVKLTCHGETKWTFLSDNLLSAWFADVCATSPKDLARMANDARDEIASASELLRALADEEGPSATDKASERTPKLTILVDNGEP